MSTKVVARTIDNPEFINVKPYNPLISECEIKVFYLGQNRNHSFISKEVATEIANSLPGCPIVGYYKEKDEDFADHGEQVVIDDEGIKFNTLTKPYGFVSPDAKIWFQKFEEEDEFGNVIEREYLMTTGYLWTGQYSEAQKVFDDDGKPHSMEFDGESLEGHWAEDVNSGMDFFIINDAIFSKLCILGDNVEPCFEGSCITAPDISTSFTKVDDNFKNTLFTMMNELKFALEGGKQMSDKEQVVETEEVVETPVEETTDVVEEETNTSETDFSKDKDEEEKYKDNKDEEKEEDKEESEDEDEEKKDEDEDKDKKYALLESKFEALETKYSQMEKEYQELLAFKNSIELAEKEELINSFYMLDEADKADVRKNIEKYSKDDIESKLSVICVRKKVKFDLENTDKNEDNIGNVTLTFTVQEEDNSSLPEWVKAVKENEN